MARDPFTYDGIIDSPIGKLGIRVSDKRLLAIDFLAPRCQPLTPTSDTARRVQRALAAYFRDASRRPELDIDLRGTAFQRRVWSGLRRLQPGKTLTYGELAGQIESGARAVGNACRANPVPILIPCHRVVAANEIGGYAGARDGKLLDIKRWLLNHEGVCTEAT